jgi:hypothetical protein
MTRDKKWTIEISTSIKKLSQFNSLADELQPENLHSSCFVM